MQQSLHLKYLYIFEQLEKINSFCAFFKLALHVLDPYVKCNIVVILYFLQRLCPHNTLELGRQIADRQAHRYLCWQWALPGTFIHLLSWSARGLAPSQCQNSRGSASPLIDHAFVLSALLLRNAR